MLSYFDQPIIIRCHRHKDYVVKSQVANLGWEEEVAAENYDRAEKMLDISLAGRSYLLLDYQENIRHPDQKIISELSQIEVQHAVS